MKTKKLHKTFYNKLQNTSVKKPLIDTYSNVTGRPYQSKIDIISNLETQIYQPVKWIQILSDIYSKHNKTYKLDIYGFGAHCLIGDDDTKFKSIAVTYKNIEI